VGGEVLPLALPPDRTYNRADAAEKRDVGREEGRPELGIGKSTGH